MEWKDKGLTEYAQRLTARGWAFDHSEYGDAVTFDVWAKRDRRCVLALADGSQWAWAIVDFYRVEICCMAECDREATHAVYFVTGGPHDEVLYQCRRHAKEAECEPFVSGIEPLDNAPLTQRYKLAVPA
jgi:hypothetical protein